MKKATMKRATWALTAAALSVACSLPPPEWQIVYDAAQALGGPQLVLAVSAIELRGEGMEWKVGGANDAEPVTWTVIDFRWTVTFCCGNTIPFPPRSQMRVQQTRVARDPSDNSRSDRQDLTLDGNVAYDVTETGTSPPLPDFVVRERRIEMLHHPVTVVRAALEHGARARNPRDEAGQRLVDISTSSGDTVTLAIDRATKLPTRVRSMIDDPILGHVAMETAFADYELVNEQLWMPRRLTRRLGDETAAEIRVTSNLADGNAGSGMRSMGVKARRAESSSRAARDARGGP